MVTKTIRALRQSPLPVLVLLAGIVLSLLVWRFADSKAEEKARGYFDLHTRDAEEAVRERFNLYTEILRGARGLFATSETVTRADWKSYADQLRLPERYAAIQGIGFIRYLPAAEKEQFENRVGRDLGSDTKGNAAFAIRPAGARQDYYPVEYFEPPLANLNLLGLDHGAYPVGRDALMQARDSGSAVISGRLGYTENKGDSARVLILLPVYRNGMPYSTIAERRNALFGFVYARINVAELLSRSIGASVVQEIYFEVFDGGPPGREILKPSAATLLYDPEGEEEIFHALNPNFKPRFGGTSRVQIAGREWIFYFASRPGFRGGAGDNIPLLLLVAGLLLTLTLFIIVLTLSVGRRRVAAEVKRQKSLIDQVLDALPVNIFLKDRNGRFVLINEETARTFGLPKEKVVGKTEFDVQPLEVAAKLRKFDDDVRTTVGVVKREERLISEGQERFMLSGKTMIAPAGGGELLLLGFSLDITEQKRAEDELRRQQKFIRNVLDTDPNLIFVKDYDGNFVLVNRATASTFGMTAEEMVGRNNADLHHNKEETDAYLRVDREVINGRKEIALDEPFTLPSGEVRWYLTVKRPLVQPDGAVHVLGIAMDITERKLAEKALRESEERLGNIIDNTTAVIFLKDLEGRYLLVNDAFAVLVGRSREQILGASDGDLFPKEIADIFRENDRRVLASGKVAEFEDRLEFANGARVFFTVKFPLRDATGMPYAVCGISTDITERLYLEREAANARANELSRSVINALGEGVIGVDRQLGITFANPQAEQFLGYSEAELRGKIVCDIVYGGRKDQDPVHPDGCPVAAVIAEGKMVHVEDTRFAHKSGSDFPVSFIAAPILENGIVCGAALSFQDITLRKQAEATLTHHINELARMNAELDEFSYVASHDLQEPTRKLLAFSDWLRRDLGDELPQRAAEDLEFIADAASRMQRLVQDLLALSRAGKASMSRENVPLDEVVDQALAALSLRIRESGAVISRDPLPAVSGDPTMLTQLYQNLIANALKFSAGSAPEIRITAEQRSAGDWIFGVRDRGIGIKPEYAELIFQPFKRLHGRGKYEGSGIGLAICRKVVERHHGRIWVESEPGQGAHFKFVLGNNKASTAG
jgi:PAS domain S-box-containing protein